MGKKEAENATLRAQLAQYGEGNSSQAQDPTDGNPEGDSQPELIDGQMFEVRGGQLVPFEPPTPGRPTQAAKRDANKDDGTAGWAYSQMAKQLGVDSTKTSWP
jgi:hypothetical protein